MLQLQEIIEYADEDASVGLTSKCSLLDAILFIQNYGLHNIRYYSPYLKYNKADNDFEWSIPFNKIETGSYIYSSNDDQSIEKLVRILCKLFPSEKGTVSIIDESNYNFYTFLLDINSFTDERIDIKILAGLLFSLTKEDESIKSLISFSNSEFSIELFSNCEKFSININHNDPTFIDKFKHVIEMLNELICTEFSNDLLTPCLIVKCYAIYYLKNVSELAQMYRFYKEILKYFKTSTAENESELKQSLVSISKNEFYFPYEKSDELPYALVPIDEEIQKQIGYFNCVENSLYHFFNCILWDGDKNEYIKINPEQPTIIDKLFSNTIRGTPNGNTLNYWHKLVENLPTGVYADQVNEKSKEVYPYYEAIKRIFYVQTLNINSKCYNYEVETGLLNFIKVLEVLSNKQDVLIKEIEYAVEKDENNKVINIVPSKLAKCINKIIQHIVGSEHAKYYEVRVNDVNYTCAYARKDIFGEFRIKRHYPNKKADVEFMLSQETYHAYMEVASIKKQKNVVNKKVFENIKNLNPVFTRHLLSEPFSKNYDKCLDLKSVNMHELMIGFRLEVNDETNNLLSKLINKYLMARDNNDENIQKKVETLCLNVLFHMPIYDPETIEALVYPIYTMKSYLKIIPIFIDELKEENSNLWSRLTYKMKENSIFEGVIRKFIASILSGNKFSELEDLFDNRLVPMIKHFEEELFNLQNISVFTLEDSLDNMLRFLAMYNYSTTAYSQNNLSMAESLLFIELILSEDIEKEIMVGFVGSFVKNFKNPKIEKIFAISEILHYYERNMLSKCIEIIQDKIIDYDIGIHILLSFQCKSFDNKFIDLLFKASNNNSEHKKLVELIISRQKRLISKTIPEDNESIGFLFSE